MQVVERKYTRRTLEPVKKEVTEQVIITSDGREWNMSDRMRADAYEQEFLKDEVIRLSLHLDEVNVVHFTDLSNDSNEHDYSCTLVIPELVTKDIARYLNRKLKTVNVDDAGNYSVHGRTRPLKPGKYLYIQNVDDMGDRPYHYAQFFGTIDEYRKEALEFMSQISSHLEIVKNL